MAGERSKVSFELMALLSVRQNMKIQMNSAAKTFLAREYADGIDATPTRESEAGTMFYVACDR